MPHPPVDIICAALISLVRTLCPPLTLFALATPTDTIPGALTLAEPVARATFNAAACSPLGNCTPDTLLRFRAVPEKKADEIELRMQTQCRDPTTLRIRRQRAHTHTLGKAYRTFDRMHTAAPNFW